MLKKEVSIESSSKSYPKEEVRTAHTEALVRELGLNEALAIGLGTMIGAGIFVLSAIAASEAGPAASLTYVLTGLVALPVAISVSELATGMPKAGGSYYLISRALGPMAGAIVGPGNWLGLIFATGFYLIGFAEYLAYFFTVPTQITVLIAGGFFLILNYRGAKISGRLQNIIVIVLVLILALFVVRGLFSIDTKLHHPFFPFGWGAVFTNIGLVIVSFTGFEKISTISEEIKRPERNLPLAIIGSVVIATILYAAILYVATGIISYQEIGRLRAPLVEAANHFMSGFGIVGMSLAALLATASSANAAIMASSRINYAMGRDRILPEWFNKIHPRYLTPHRSILITGTLAILLALSGRVESLAEISSALFMVSYALISLSLLVMHRTKPTWYRPSFLAPFYPWLTIAGGVLALAVIGTMDRFSQIAGVGLIVLSVGWYLVWGRKRTSVEGEFIPWLERERPLEAVIANMEQAVEKKYPEILVPLANPRTAESLTNLAISLAHGNEKMRVTALRIVPVPINLSLKDANAYLNISKDHQKILKQALEVGERKDMWVETLLRAAYGIGSGIVAVAKSRPDAQMILLGWHGPLTLANILNSIDKEVLQSAPCDVAVLMERHLNGIKRILLPLGGGPHARLGLRLATNLANGEMAELVVLRVVKRLESTDMEVEKAALEKIIKDELKELPDWITPKVVKSTRIIASILKEARNNYDLIVIGASEEWFMQNWLFGSIPDIVANRAPCSVLMVKKHEPTPLSWLRRIGGR